MHFSSQTIGTLNSSLQILHTHILLIAPLEYWKDGAASHRPASEPSFRPGKYPPHADTAADLPVQTFKHIIGADASPVLTGKIAAGQRFLNATLHLSWSAVSSPQP